MASYMPREHRVFLHNTAKLPSLRDYVESRPDDVRLFCAYNGCLQELSNWRSRHIGVVTTHIITQSRNEKPVGKRPDPEEVTDGLSVVDESKLQGTGGSALIPFLKQAKKETLDSRI
jgi:indoleamine 2,3-dioxygenase